MAVSAILLALWAGFGATKRLTERADGTGKLRYRI